MVQGVGFRPFVAELAQSMGISGSVRNSGGIVHITASGTEGRLKEFCRRIEEEAPREAYIQKIKILPLSESSRKKNSSLEIIPKDSFPLSIVPGKAIRPASYRPTSLPALSVSRNS